MEPLPSGKRTESANGSPPPRGFDATTAGLTRSAGAVSIGVMGSRILGLAREMLLAFLFPAGLGLDAFYAAFRIPNLLRDMFGEGALSKAFVSAFTEVEEKQGRAASLRLANQVLNALLLAVGVLTVVGILFADVIVALMLPGGGFDITLPAADSYGFATKRELTVFLTRLMFPFILFVTLAALVMGLLNARGIFSVPAWASSFFNLGSIGVGLAGYFLAPRYGYHPTAGMAIGVLAGGVLQLLWQIPSLFATGFRYQPILSFRDPGVRKVLRLFGPGALVAATVQVNVFINAVFASMGAGWLSWISQAFRLVHLPIGLIGVALSVATLPSLSRSAARGDQEGFRETFSYATRLVILFNLPATVGLVVLAEPIVRLVYQRGAFGPLDTHQVAQALVFYALGLMSYAAVKIVTDGFYALQDIRAPMVVSLLSMGFNASLNWIFIFVLDMDHRGLALATSCTITLSFVSLWLLLRRRSGLRRLGGRRALVMSVKMLVASAVMGFLASMTSRGIERWLGGEDLAARMTQVGLSIGVALFALYGACRLLRVREMDEALRAIAPRALGWR